MKLKKQNKYLIDVIVSIENQIIILSIYTISQLTILKLLSIMESNLSIKWEDNKLLSQYYNQKNCN